MTFYDHFSAAQGYARFRPDYDAALGDWLASLTNDHALAMDVATGSGQAARLLAPHFERVIACDASKAQLQRAEAPDNVSFLVAPAEYLPAENNSVALLTVAQALHWFDLDAFYREVRRVLRPGGVIAVWSYNRLAISPAVDAHVERLYSDVLGDYWPPERRHVEDGYATLPFPFTPVAAPTFAMTAEWDCDHLLGYLGTWSATRAYIAAKGMDPVAALAPALRDDYGPGTRHVNWPLTLRVGRT